MSIEENQYNFINSVRRLREQSGWSIEELAKKSGVSLEMLELLEQNILPGEMMTSDAYNLAVAFHCKIAELFRE